MGSNMAECHPVGFQWVMEAKLRGATVIHVDPRFSRTSAVADVFVAHPGRQRHRLPRRRRQPHPGERQGVPGLRGGLHQRLRHPVGEDFRDTEDLDGLFSGWDPETGSYDNTSWQYAGQTPATPTPAASSGRRRRASSTAPTAAHGGKPPETDPTLEHPRCVFQVLKRHFPRYTPELVEEVCGVPRERFLEVAEALCRNSGRERTTAFCYAVGLDPAHRRRAVHPHRGHHPAPARQHRPARRRHPRPAGPRQHPGVHRHPHPLRPAARLPGHAPRRPARRPRHLRRGPDARPPAPGPTSTPTWSACSRRGGATTPPPTTTSASTTCPASPATTPPTRPCWACSTAR